MILRHALKDNLQKKLAFQPEFMPGLDLLQKVRKN